MLALVIAREGELQIPTLKALNFHSPGLPRERLPWEDDPQYAVANPVGVARDQPPLCNPFRVDGFLRSWPRVAAARQPWALECNPFRVDGLSPRRRPADFLPQSDLARLHKGPSASICIILLRIGLVSPMSSYFQKLIGPESVVGARTFRFCHSVEASRRFISSLTSRRRGK